MNATPLQRYQRDLEREGFCHDAAQASAVQHLQQLYDELVIEHRRRASRPRWLDRLRRLVGGRTEPVRGLYFWGGVGRGKTYLMDNFYDSLPFPQKMRVHFHRFMRRVHRELCGLEGEKNPLQQVAERLAGEAWVLCFDEFFVADITDAMILANMLEALFQRGVCLVATSNIEPDGLYRDGLQRVRFVPAIELLKRHTRVVNIDGGIDYRLRALEQAELYHSPLDAAADASLLASFESLVPDRQEIRANVALEVENRELCARFEAEDVVWFDFKVLCDGPRSQNDYIALAREYHAVLVANVPQMDRKAEDQARRFVNMVDEFYDRNVKLVLSAAVPLEQLYVGKKLTFEFARTTSRLLEMQSREYLGREHRA
ncbi:AFG1 family ATPase [Exilibacterium tricleocarpae]|uniref:Cell division protein ZapE n=1 Tax=Exilibacterium tricleocarpae TaxID=2591008 RepID=A0A545TSJ2_9GAMM|nr:cell division protein ZapE [Exilibacterium tricleocarpae]TQV80186.1 AFG1 family ATPase [Exilibacterium tricleocarpae]